MKTSLIVLSLLIATISSAYDRKKAVAYAYQYVHDANHKCGSGSYKCTPYGYFGSEQCNYKSQGGDCANFVSQCLIAGGHSKLTKGVCRGNEFCGAEVGAWELSTCLPESYGYKYKCGLHLAPPKYIEQGDVLVYFSNAGCTGSAHAVLVTKVSGSSVKVTCHSSEQKDVNYNYLKDTKPYYKWIHIN